MGKLLHKGLFAVCVFVWATAVANAVPVCKIAETGIQYSNLQAALDVAFSGQHIYVFPGTHTGDGNAGLI